MWRSPPSLAGPPVLAGLPGLPLQARPLQSLAGMVGASWDLQVEGYRRGEGTDLVPPAGLLPNGNRCPLRSIPCRPQGPPIYTPSPARIVPPCTGDTRADRYS